MRTLCIKYAGWWGGDCCVVAKPWAARLCVNGQCAGVARPYYPGGRLPGDPWDHNIEAYCRVRPGPGRPGLWVIDEVAVRTPLKESARGVSPGPGCLSG